MNTLRRISRHLVTAVAASVVLIAAAVPLAIAESASAAGTTLTCIALTNACGGGQTTTTVTFGTGATGTLYFAGTGFADDQNTGGTVTITSSAPGLTFSSVTEVSLNPAYTDTATYTSTAATVPGFYSLTLTDDNGTSTLSNAVQVYAGPSVTSVTGNSGTAGGGTSTVTVTGTFAGSETGAFAAPTSGTAPTLVTGTNNTTTYTATVTNLSATAGSYSLVISEGVNGSVTVPYTVNGASGPTLTAITVAASGTSELLIPGTGSSVESVTVSGTGFENGATVTISNLEGGTLTAPSSVTFVSATSITFNTTVTSAAPTTQTSLVVQNPDGGVTTNGTNALGVGEAGAALSSGSSAPVAPSITASTATYGNLQPGGVSIIFVTGSSSFPITTGATVKLTLTADTSTTPYSVTGTVLSVSSSNVAEVKISLPRYLVTTTTAAVAAGATSLPVADGYGIANASTFNIVDGANSEKATAAGAGTATSVAVSALANAHAAGTSVDFQTPGTTWTLSINNGSTTQSTTTTTTAAGASTLTDANGVAVSTLTPGTYTLTDTSLGFGFTSGATITFPGASTNGVTGSYVSGTGNSANFKVTVPANIPLSGSTLSSAVNSGQKVLCLATPSGAAAPIAGQTLTIDPNALVSATETVTIASVVTSSSTLCTMTTPSTSYVITLVNGFTAPHPSGTAVAGVLEANPGGTAVTAFIGNGSGQTDIVSTFFTTAAAPAFSSISPATVPAGIGNLDPARTNINHVGSGYYVAFSTTAASFPTADTATSCNTANASASCADWTITSTNAAVKFTLVSVSSGNPDVIDAYATVAPGTPAISAVPVTIADGHFTISTSSTETFGITAGPTATSVTAEGTLHAGTASSDSESIGILGTGFSTTTANDTVAFVTAAGTVDSHVAATVTAATATTLTVTVTANAGALNGTDGVVVEVSNGESAVLPAALIVSAPVISAVAPSTVSVVNTGTGTFTATTTGFSSTGTFTCAISSNAGSSSPSTVTTAPTCAAAYVSGSTSSVTVTLTYTGANYTAGGLLLTLTNSSQQASIALTALTTPVVSSLTINTTVGTIANGSSNVPATIGGTGFLPGATVAVTSSGGTFVVSSVTPTSIVGTLSLTYTATQPIALTVSNTNGATGSFSGGAFGATPTVTGTYLGLEGTTKSLVITGTGFVSGAVVTSSVAGTVTFGTAVVNSSTKITVPATYVGFTGTTPIVTSIVVTNPIGQGSATDANALTINPGPTVTGTYYVPTFSTSVEYPITGTGFESGMTVTSSNSDYTVSLASVNAAGTVATLLVTTDSNATSGTSSTITFTNPDGGSVQFALNGGPEQSTTPVLAIHKITGTAIVGKTSSILVTGTGFYGQPKVTSTAAGTKAVVSADSGTVLTIKVTTKASTKPGTFTFTITLANGSKKTVNYGVRKA